MLDASINKAQPTMFVNIGLQNGVLLRTVLDPINGQLTDTRTRYVKPFLFFPVQFPYIFSLKNQIFGNTPRQTLTSTNPTESCHLGSLFAIVAELYLPKPHALHAAYLRQPRLCMEFLCGAQSGRPDWYCWECSSVCGACQV